MTRNRAQDISQCSSYDSPADHAYETECNTEFPRVPDSVFNVPSQLTINLIQDNMLTAEQYKARLTNPTQLDIFFQVTTILSSFTKQENKIGLYPLSYNTSFSPESPGESPRTYNRKQSTNPKSPLTENTVALPTIHKMHPETCSKEHTDSTRNAGIEYDSTGYQKLSTKTSFLPQQQPLTTGTNTVFLKTLRKETTHNCFSPNGAIYKVLQGPI